MRPRLLLFILPVFFVSRSYAQCCSAGSGSPIADGASQGVLQERQLEFSASYQYVSTNKVFSGDSVDLTYLNKFVSNYTYLRAAYGVTRNFTFSVESGYYFNKTEIGVDWTDTMTSNGIGDLVIFPRYTVYSNTGIAKRTEISLGLGWKIPIGNYADSTTRIEPFSGNPYYLRNPPSVQTTNGANDFIFYAFLFRGYPLKNLRLFSNMIYIHKGWNPIGEKNGEYASLSLFAGKTLFEKLGVTLQLRGEYIGRARLNHDLLNSGYYNYDTLSTGSRKIFIAPQLNYSFQPFSLFLLAEFPVYQNMNVTAYTSQIGSQYSYTGGISYRFFPSKGKLKNVPDLNSDSE